MSEQIPVQDVTPPSSAKNAGVDLYASREKIYTRAFTGLYRNLRLAGGALLFLLFFGTVWLNWEGRQAVWWNLPERKFHIFGATYWPQDFMLLSWLLIICALACSSLPCSPGVSGAATPARKAYSPGSSCGRRRSPRVTATSA